MSSRTLVTGFGPFLEVKHNPSARLAAALGRPHQVLEVSYEAADRFLASLDPDSFDRLVLLGVAASRSHVCIELFARNWRGSAPDVSGVATSGPIDEGQPLLVSGSLVPDELLSTLLVQHSELRASLDAGSYLCNYTYFRALQRFGGKRIGFIHVAPFERIAEPRQVDILKAIIDSVE